MKTSISLPRAASLLLLLLLSLAFVLPIVQAQTDPPVQTEQVAVDEVAIAREQIAQFRQTLEGLSPIERRDALREFIETNFPNGIPVATVDAATLNQRLAEQDSKPVPALKLPANATPAQIAYLKARRQLLVALRAARRVAFGDNTTLTPEQRRTFTRQWLQTQGADLLAKVRQAERALSPELQQKMLQRRQAQAVSASIVPPSIAQTDPALADAMAQRNAIDAEAAQILARTDLATPIQRRDALRGWYEANKARIDSASRTLTEALSTSKTVSEVEPNAVP